MTKLDEVINLEKNELTDEECWTCRRTKDELENLGIELFQIEGTTYEGVCRGCEETEPKTFWDDMNWEREHYAELVRKYPGKWVAIVDRVVVAVGD